MPKLKLILLLNMLLAMSVDALPDGFYIHYKRVAGLLFKEAGNESEMPGEETAISINDNGTYTCIRAKTDLLGVQTYRMVWIDESGAIISEDSKFIRNHQKDIAKTYSEISYIEREILVILTDPEIIIKSLLLYVNLENRLKMMEEWKKQLDEGKQSNEIEVKPEVCYYSYDYYRFLSPL